MGQRIITGVPNGEVTGFCRLQRALGATKCEPTDDGDGTSEVLVEFPDRESFDEHKERVNS
jgi:hypothetical protein